MKLYYTQGSCSLAPHIILEELGIPYTAQQLVGDNGDHSRPEFLKLNPNGAVPVLEFTDGRVLTEGVAIQQYLADLRPELGLAPRNGTWERTQLQETMNFIATELHKGVGALFTADRLVQSPAAREELRQSLMNGAGEKLDIMNAKMNGKKFAFGDSFSIADAYLFTVFSWVPYVGMNADKWPNLVAHAKMMAERPAVHRTLVSEDLL